MARPKTETERMTTIRVRASQAKIINGLRIAKESNHVTLRRVLTYYMDHHPAERKRVKQALFRKASN